MPPTTITRTWTRDTLVPWHGRPTRVDAALLAAIAAVVVIGLVMRPITPFLLASHPVLLEFLSGDTTAVAAAAAFARIGEVPLWSVVVAGAVGMVKLDWITWWTGRRWGSGIVTMFATSDRARRLALRAGELSPWVVRAAVVFAGLPGVPSAVVFAVAGLNGMRLRTFLLLDLVGAALITGVVAGIGYALGQQAVDVVLLVDRYAGWVSVAMLAATVTLPLLVRWLRGRRAHGHEDTSSTAMPAKRPRGWRSTT